MFLFFVVGEDEEWGTDSETMTAEETVDKIKIEKKDDEKETNDEEKKSKDIEEHAPRIRLKPNLATDPALQPQAVSVAQVKTELESNQSPTSTTEYLNSLPAAIQSAIARGFYLPISLGENSAVNTNRSEDITRQPPTVPIYICNPCGIRFSSLSTLEAHQTYYCSHRANNKNTNEVDDAKSLSSTEPSGSQSDQDGSESVTKAVKTGKQYTCTHCTYSADKKVSLNRHMRMHTVSPTVSPSVSVSNGDLLPETQDRYCTECDIRFSSQKTYRAHKMHYCSSRHMIKQQVNPAVIPPVVNNKPASCTSESTPTSPVDTTSCRSPQSPTNNSTTTTSTTTVTAPQQPFLALPTNPIIIVPYSLFRGASILSGILPNVSGIPNPNSPCFLLPNGTIQPMSQALSTPATVTQTDVLKMSNKPKESSMKDSSAPLDLSVRKSPDISNEKETDHEKENLKRKTPSPEKIECVPSLHGSPPLTPSSRTGISPSLSASPKRKYEDSRSNSPRQTRVTPKSVSSDNEMTDTTIPPSFNFPVIHPFLRGSALIPELQLRLGGEIPGTAAVAAAAAAAVATIPAPSTPQVLVKQGVSKCKECNIVFCKHENYLIHKKHYCSARLQEDESSKNSASPPISPGSVSGTTPAGQYQQLICLACGIKFTSLDNLNAHQSYYCLKRNEVDVRRCGKCRAIAEPGHQCVQTTGLSAWKCPCCDVVSHTASAAQRHMETHSGVKAYRCRICRYKGNTLRGMRTHIRMHFDKRSPDLQVIAYFILLRISQRYTAELRL